MRALGEDRQRAGAATRVGAHDLAHLGPRAQRTRGGGATLELGDHRDAGAGDSRVKAPLAGEGIVRGALLAWASPARFPPAGPERSATPPRVSRACAGRPPRGWRRGCARALSARPPRRRSRGTRSRSRDRLAAAGRARNARPGEPAGSVAFTGPPPRGRAGGWPPRRAPAPARRPRRRARRGRPAPPRRAWGRRPRRRWRRRR